jgi:hypothetical protein
MKVVPQASVGSSNKKHHVVPPILFEQCADDTKSLQKHVYLTFKLRSVPTAADSPVYELSVPFFNKGSCELYLITLRHLGEIVVGQNINDAPGMYALARQVFKGDALATFNTAATIAGAETIANYQQAIRALTRHVFPRHAYAMQKRYMQRFLRKPLGTPIRDFIAHLIEMNNYLPQFPPQQLGGAVGVILDDEELKEVGEFSIPDSWQKGMVQHGFDPADHLLNELIEFCECFEYTEDHDPASIGQKPKHQAGVMCESKPHAKSSARGNQSSGRSQAYHGGDSRHDDSANKRKRSAYDPNAYCQLHEQWGHWTDDCTVVKAQLEAMKSQYQAHKRANNNVFGNKGWRKPGSDAKAPSPQQKNKNELHALMEKEIDRRVANRLKRQHDEDIFAFEQLSISDDEDQHSTNNKKMDSDEEHHA